MNVNNVLVMIFALHNMCNMCHYVFQIIDIMTDHSFFMKRCVKYCKIIRLSS